MKHFKYTLLGVVLTLAASVSAKQLKTDKLYMFGFSASFKDSVVYVTDIQNVQGAWIDTKTKFLLGRDEYSRQLKNYLTDQLQQPKRVCLVFFEMSRKKAEKQYLKLMKKYKKGYEIRYLNATEFKFEAIDASDDEEEE